MANDMHEGPFNAKDMGRELPDSEKLARAAEQRRAPKFGTQTIIHRAVVDPGALVERDRARELGVGASAARYEAASRATQERKTVPAPAFEAMNDEERRAYFKSLEPQPEAQPETAKKKGWFARKFGRG